MGVPEYVKGEDLTHYADDHGIEENTLVRGEFGNTPAQATKTTDTYVLFSNGEKHTHRQLAHAVENGHIEVVGERATR